jgi:hypothetical protein
VLGLELGLGLVLVAVLVLGLMLLRCRGGVTAAVLVKGEGVDELDFGSRAAGAAFSIMSARYRSWIINSFCCSSVPPSLHGWISKTVLSAGMIALYQQILLADV